MARSLVPPSLASGVSMSGILRCQRCEDVIGVYEPMVICSGGDAWVTSLAATPELPNGPPDWFHRACFQSQDPGTLGLV